MKNYVTLAAVAATFSLIGVSSSQAALINVSGGPSSAGDMAAIISAPTDVSDDAAYNTAIQGFDEQQFYTLTSDLSVDGGTILSGTVVNSHMIFLNSGPNNNDALIEHGAKGNQNTVSFQFNGDILGVMSDSGGLLEAASQFLGATGTTYPGSAFPARGMEGNPLTGGTTDDWYSFAGDTINLGMRVTEPGDWIRVITVAPIPVPATLPLLGSVLALFAVIGGKRRRKVA